jgi:hypothetical protein
MRQWRGIDWQSPTLFIRTVLARDWKFLGVTLLSCAVAAIVATFQYSVYTSFIRTGAIVPRVLGGDFWVTAASVECFDFPNAMSEDYAETLTRYVPDAAFRRVVFGFAPWRSPTGQRGNVAIVGVDGTGLGDSEFLVDRADMARLDLAAPREGLFQQASISDTTLSLASTVDTMPTFLGAPYVIVPFERGRELLAMDPTSTSYLIGSFTGAPRDLAREGARATQAFPDVALVSAQDFQASSSLYWQKKTGAGLAVLIAAVLAGLLMAILLANGLQRFIQRYHQDFVSLLGHGADGRDISVIVGGIGMIIALATMVAAMVVTPVIIALFKPLLPWAQFKLVDALVPLAAILVSLIVAMLVARRSITAFGPELVFRS